MTAKKTKPSVKATTKKVRSTAVSKSVKAKKPAAKASKKTKKPVISDADFEAWFLKQSSKHFIHLTTEWNEKNLKVTIKTQDNYDQWLNYFKTLPPNKVKLLATTGLDILPTEAYAALLRWHDILSNPARIDKIHQAGLTNAQGKDKHSIVSMALKNDRYGVLCATRDKIAEKLDKGAGSRDTALLTREMTEIMTQIADYEKRLGPKKTTVLGKLLDDMPTTKKRPSKNGGGARNTSFKSRITIEDVENA